MALFRMKSTSRSPRTATPMAGLLVRRLVYVPATGGDYARYLEVLENTGASPISTTVEVYGNLGSDGATQEAFIEGAIGGFEIPVLRTTDGAGADPPVYTTMVPSDLAELDRVVYQRSGDNVTITAAQVGLPVTIYVALSYSLDTQAVVDALIGDLELEAGGEAAGGAFRLTVEER